jgi:uncharacterized protein YfiM (DUF2279 family)
MIYRVFTVGSLFLTAALLACGMSFFSPYWLQNVKASEFENSTYMLDAMNGTLPVWGGSYSRGLWAQCGRRCQWFWENGFMLQTNLFTPLRWHLATQVLYTIGAVLVLFCEIFSRVQLCCEPSRRIYATITGLLVASFFSQLSAVAVFGACSWTAYMASSMPLENYPWETTDAIYFHWSFWMAVAGGIATLISIIFFAVLGCCCKARWQK